MTRTLLIVAVALAGCTVASDRAGGLESPRRAPDRSGTAYAELNQTVRLGDLTVRPLAVTEDSRCPSSVACVWAGRVVLRVRVSGLGDRTISSIEPLALAGGGTLALTDIWPPRIRGGSTVGPYRFGFRRS